MSVAGPLLPLSRERRMAGFGLTRTLHDIVAEAIGQLIERAVQATAARLGNGTTSLRVLIKER